MNQHHSTSNAPLTGKRVYSAPRRFDLATLFVVMVVYACLLGIFVGMKLPDVTTISILGFMSVIAAAQPALFGGNRPRMASLVVGGIALPVIFWLASPNIFERVSGRFILFVCASYIPLGSILGYLTGTLVGGVFLVADMVRQGRGVVK